MRRKRLLFAMAFLVIGALGGNLFAQDITSSYLTNPGFEDGSTNGWTVGHTNTSYYNDGVNYSHDHFGNPGTDEGSHYFGISSRWNNSNGSNTVSLSQNTKASLPSGHYYISCDYKAADYSSNNGFRSPIRMYAKAGETELGVSDPYHLAANFTSSNNEYMPKSDWTPVGCYFENTSDQEITVMVSSSLWSNNGTQFAFDNFKLFDISQAASENPIDMSGVIANNKMEAAGLAWTDGFASQENTNYTNFSGRYMMESWVQNANNLANKDINQTVKKLPNGKYKFSAYVIATKQNASDPSAVTGVSLYAGNNNVACGTQNNTPTLFSVETTVTNGELKLGIKAENCTANWIAWDNLKLEYIEPVIEYAAVELPANGAMEANKWYYIDITGSSNVTTSNGPVLYTQDGDELMTTTNTESFTNTQLTTEGRYYVKSSTANTLSFEIEAKDGWEILSALPDDLNDYFYTFYSGKYGLKLETGNNQGSEYKTLWYRQNVDPEVDKDALMTIVQNGQNQVVTCATEPNLMLQTEYNAGWFYRTHDNGGGNINWGNVTFTQQANGKWTVTNGTYPDGSWGHWDNTDEIAANRAEADQYNIHAIKRGQYLQNVLTDDYYNLEDISYVITNPEAERMSAVGWTLSEAGAFETQNNTALANKTNSRYFQFWQASGAISNRSMSQTLTNLKEGYYTLEVNTNVTETGAFLYVNGEQVDLSENENGLAKVKVHVDADGTLDYGVKLEGYTGNWVAFDNFKLYYSSEDPLIEDGIYYLYSQNEISGEDSEYRFLGRGENWGTHAVTDAYGQPIQIKNVGGNVVTFYFVDAETYMKNAGGKLFTDGSTSEIIRINVAEGNSEGVDTYIFSAEGVDDAIFNNEWQLLSVDERNEIIDNYPTVNMSNVISSATEGGLYSILPSAENVPASQFEYWLNAECEVIDKTDKINTPTFADGNLGGWTYTPNNRGGNPGYNSGVTEIYEKQGTWTQTVSGLEPGIYKLTVNAFERHGDTANALRVAPDYKNLGAAYMKANGEQVQIAAWHEAYSDENNPNTMAQAAEKFKAGNYENVVFAYVGESGDLTIQVAEPEHLAAIWFTMNNFTLTYYKPTTKEIATPEGEYYLRNKATGEYLTFDGYWGTYYSMSDVGKVLNLETSDEGFTLMHTTYLSNSNDVTSSTDTENYFYSYPDNPMHAFSNGNSHEGGEKWVFYETGANTGTYHIMNYMTGNYLSGTQGYDDDNRGWGGLLKETATSDDLSVQWELVSFEDLYEGLTATGATYPRNASFLIGEPDLIAGWNNVYEEFYRWKVLGNDQFKYSDWKDSNITTFQFDRTNGTSEGNSTYAYCVASDYPDILQTIENVPAGLYVVECQAVFRDGDGGDESDNPAASVGSSSRKNADRLADKTYVNRAYLYANDKMAEAPIDDAMAMRDRAWIYENAQLMPVNIATDHTFDNAANPAIFTKFKNRECTVQLPIYVTDTGDGTGTLTIGVLQEIGINNNLLVFDRFRLNYYGTNYTGNEVKDIMKSNLQRLSEDYDNYQSNTVIEKEIDKVRTAINTIDGATDYNSNSETVAQYNKVAQDYGETSISWYIYNVLMDDYDHGAYTTASSQEHNDGIYPYVDEASKKEVVKYFGAGTNTNNNKNIYDNTTYSNGELVGKYNMGTKGTLEDLRAAISAIRTYVASNAEARYIEDEKAIVNGEIEDTEEARTESRMTRMALVTGSKEAITTEDGKRPYYDTNPLMFVNTGAEIIAPELNKIVTNARCWAPRDAYGHRFYDYTNYYHYGAGNESSYEIEIDGLMTGKYLVTISESHNNELTHVKFNAYVGDNQVVTDKELFRQDESVWQTYTHSWQDVSVVAEISDKFEPVRLCFVGGGDGSSQGATMNVCNLRIYRLDDVEMLLLDENETILAKNGHKDQLGAYHDYESVKVLFKREMQTNQWNTLTLPVSLTKEQVISGFGEGTIIAVMDGFAADSDYEGDNPYSCIHFKTNNLSNLRDDAIAIEAGKVILIKPTADPAVAAGETAKYKNPYEGQSIFTDVEGPIYYLDYVKYALGDGECNRDGNVVSHGTPETDTPIGAGGAMEGHLSLQMDGTYVKTVVPVGETDYIYAFQNQNGTVNLVQLDPSKSKTYEGFGETVGRQFKGFRGWITANYDGGQTSGEVKSNYIVLLDEGDGEATIIRGIDSKDGYSETKINSKGIYDLQGRAIDSELFNSPACPKGVYIVNGKKVLVK